MAKTETEDTAVATNDAYTGMLAISLLALILGCVFLYLDWSQYPDKPPPRASVPARSAPAPAPGPVGGAPPGQPPVANPMNPGVPMPMVPPAPMPNPNMPPEPKQ